MCACWKTPLMTCPHLDSAQICKHSKACRQSSDYLQTDEICDPHLVLRAALLEMRSGLLPCVACTDLTTLSKGHHMNQVQVLDGKLLRALQGSATASTLPEQRSSQMCSVGPTGAWSRMATQCAGRYLRIEACMPAKSLKRG